MIHRLWIIRHGATAWTKSGQHTSITDLPLLPEGEAEARAVKERLGNFHFDHIRVSPLLRARQTAEIIGFKGFEIDPRLIEWRYGIAEGKKRDELRTQFDPGWALYTHAAQTPGAEKIPQIEERIDALLADLLELGKKEVALVTSGHFGRALAMRWVGLPIKEAAHFPLETASISILGFDRGARAILKWNDGHLE